MLCSLRFIRFIRVGGVVPVVGSGRGLGVVEGVEGCFWALAAPFYMRYENWRLSMPHDSRTIAAR